MLVMRLSSSTAPHGHSWSAYHAHLAPRLATRRSPALPQPRDIPASRMGVGACLWEGELLLAAYLGGPPAGQGGGGSRGPGLSNKPPSLPSDDGHQSGNAGCPRPGCRPIPVQTPRRPRRSRPAPPPVHRAAGRRARRRAGPGGPAAGKAGRPGGGRRRACPWGGGRATQAARSRRRARAPGRPSPWRRCMHRPTLPPPFPLPSSPPKTPCRQGGDHGQGRRGAPHSRQHRAQRPARGARVERAPRRQAGGARRRTRATRGGGRGRGALVRLFGTAPAAARCSCGPAKCTYL
jgi:hypothetical protein